MIYYVEDDTNIRDLTVYALRQAGFDSCGFSCAEDFFAALETQIPELVLLDIMLPETDGLEILSQLRAGAATKHVPVMMLTAKGTEYDTVCGLDAGADDYLSKAFRHDGTGFARQCAFAPRQRAGSCFARYAYLRWHSAFGGGAHHHGGRHPRCADA
ncbi:MAG: response regulator [Raoultibacter sp.]